MLNTHKQDDIITALKLYPPKVRAAVESVSVDMWGGYTTVIETVFPNARIVYDRFHVMQHVNRELNQLRRQMSVKLNGLPHLLWKNRSSLKRRAKAATRSGVESVSLLDHRLRIEVRPQTDLRKL